MKGSAGKRPPFWKLCSLIIKLASVGTAIAGTFAISASIERDQMETAQTSRSFDQIHIRAQTAQNIETLLIGDSITDSLSIGDDCGPVLQATIPGVTSAEYASHLPNLIDTVKPRRLIVALGTNDTEYTLPALNAPLQTALFGTSNNPAMNAQIAAIARQKGFAFIPMPAAGKDGKHPDLDGLKRLKRSIKGYCSQK